MFWSHRAWRCLKSSGTLPLSTVDVTRTQMLSEVCSGSAASRPDSCCTRWTRDQLRWGAAASGFQWSLVHLTTVTSMIVTQSELEVVLCRRRVTLRAPSRVVFGTSVPQVLQTVPILHPMTASPAAVRRRRR